MMGTIEAGAYSNGDGVNYGRSNSGHGLLHTTETLVGDSCRQ